MLNFDTPSRMTSNLHRRLPNYRIVFLLIIYVAINTLIYGRFRFAISCLPVSHQHFQQTWNISPEQGIQAQATSHSQTGCQQITESQ